LQEELAEVVQAPGQVEDLAVAVVLSPQTLAVAMEQQTKAIAGVLVTLQMAPVSYQVIIVMRLAELLLLVVLAVALVAFHQVVPQLPLATWAAPACNLQLLEQQLTTLPVVQAILFAQHQHNPR
jgi:hypothetical protein